MNCLFPVVLFLLHHVNRKLGFIPNSYLIFNNLLVIVKSKLVSAFDKDLFILFSNFKPKGILSFEIRGNNYFNLEGFNPLCVMWPILKHGGIHSSPCSVLLFDSCGGISTHILALFGSTYVHAMGDQLLYMQWRIQTYSCSGGSTPAHALGVHYNPFSGMVQFYQCSEGSNF